MSVASEPDAILVAEGDALIRMVMVDMLSDAGFAVTTAPDAADALAVLKARPEIRALIAGRTLTAVGDGIGLVHRARADRPHLAILITSGAASDLPPLLPEGVRILWKPFHFHVLAQLIVEEIHAVGSPSAAPLLPEGSPTSPGAAPVHEPDRS